MSHMGIRLSSPAPIICQPLSLSFPFWTDALSFLLQGGQSLSFSLGLALSETEKTYNWVTSIAFRMACGLSCT